jgi:hypothetical protein
VQQKNEAQEIKYIGRISSPSISLPPLGVYVLVS